MISKSALVWDQKILFSRYIEECGVSCEFLTPHMIAAPFYRGSFVTLIVPTGFANPAFSGLLPGLKATAPRIKRFVERGGNLLVFGAASSREDAYSWLPINLRYHHDYGQVGIQVEGNHPGISLVQGYDTTCIDIDGYFTNYDGVVIANVSGNPVMVACRVGKGEVIATTIHEYPSPAFVRAFCTAPEEALF
jgi:glutamine amidotransferase-like uncharacterized protein